MYSVAQPFQILALGGTPLQLGIGAAITTATMLVFLLVGGVIVDRIPRRRIILASDLAGGCIVAIVAALGLSGALRIEHLYLASAFFGMSAKVKLVEPGTSAPMSAEMLGFLRSSTVFAGWVEFTTSM